MIFIDAVDTLLFVNTGIFPEKVQALTNTEWLIPGLFTALCALLFWFIRDKFGDIKDKCGDLADTDERIEKNVKTIGKWTVQIAKSTHGIDKRVGRIEGKLKLSPFVGYSPLRLSKLGEEILEQSGIREAIEEFKDQLLKEIQERKPNTAYDVQEVTRQVFQEFDFGEAILKKLKNYAFQSDWGLPDILDVGATYFRNTALDKLGFKLEDLNKDPQT